MQANKISWDYPFKTIWPGQRWGVVFGFKTFIHTVEVSTKFFIEVSKATFLLIKNPQRFAIRKTEFSYLHNHLGGGRGVHNFHEIVWQCERKVGIAYYCFSSGTVKVSIYPLTMWERVIGHDCYRSDTVKVSILPLTVWERGIGYTDAI